jgi:hypothetical protein
MLVGRMKVPRRVLAICGFLCALRCALFLFVWLQNDTSQAQWQLAYLLFLPVDFPVSVLYRHLPVPVPEGLVGPIWWFLMPLGIWWLVWGRHRSGKVDTG